MHSAESHADALAPCGTGGCGIATFRPHTRRTIHSVYLAYATHLRAFHNGTQPIWRAAGLYIHRRRDVGPAAARWQRAGDRGIHIGIRFLTHRIDLRVSFGWGETHYELGICRTVEHARRRFAHQPSWARPLDESAAEQGHGIL